MTSPNFSLSPLSRWQGTGRADGAAGLTTAKLKTSVRHPPPSYSIPPGRALRGPQKCPSISNRTFAGYGVLTDGIPSRRGSRGWGDEGHKRGCEARGVPVTDVWEDTGRWERAPSQKAELGLPGCQGDGKDQV